MPSSHGCRYGIRAVRKEPSAYGLEPDVPAKARKSVQSVSGVCALSPCMLCTEREHRHAVHSYIIPADSRLWRQPLGT
jgi:hypothetical protein